MAVWMEYEQFKKQVEAGADIEAKAPCPSASDGLEARTSYWIDQYPVDFESSWRDAQLPSDVDVVIIGSGITGATVAYQLSRRQPSLKVAVLDARGICTGATGRNGGHLCRPETYDMRYLAQTFGAEQAVRLRRLPIITRDMMLDTVEELGIADEIDLCLGGTITIFGSQEERDDVAADAECASSLGMPVESYLLDKEALLERLEISDHAARYGGAVIDKSGSFYPRKFVAALFRQALVSMPNLSLHPFTAATSVTPEEGHEDRYTVSTSKGSIRTKVVVHATNAWASNLIPSLQGTKGVFGVKCHVVSIHPTAKNAEMVKPGFGYDRMWHWAIQRPNQGPFIYGWSGAEQIADYNDSITIDDEKIYETMFEFLKMSMPKSFPDLPSKKDISHDWCGIQGFTSNGASLVGRPLKERPGEFVAVGFNGEGMGRCFSCATVLTDKILHFMDDKLDEQWSAPEWFPRSFLQNI